jgi:chitodextrinase
MNNFGATFFFNRLVMLISTSLKAQMQKIKFCTFSWLLFALLSFNIFAQSSSMPTDRDRLKIEKIADIRGGDSLHVVRTDAGTPLRGGSPWIEKKQTQLSSIREDFIKDQSDAGMNSIRLIWFEAWQQAAGYDAYTNFNNPEEVAHCLAMIESYVNLCSKYGMYCIINFHSKFGSEYDIAYSKQMWTAVAAHFKDRTHVAYETANEPSNDFNVWMGDAEIGKHVDIYNLVKELAPNTMQFVLTPNRLPDSYPTAVDLADRLSDMTSIDWSNTVVGYHLYAGSLNGIRTLHKKYPAFPTENNFPLNSGANKDPWPGVSLDGDWYTSQTCEKFGLGWFQWAISKDCDCYEGWYANWPLMLSDALTKGWYWGKEGLVDEIAPSAPTTLSISYITSNRIGISWRASEDNNLVIGYEVFLNGKSIGSTAFTSMEMDKLEADSMYEIVVKARDVAGNHSESSSALNAKTKINIALNKPSFTSSNSSASFSGNKAVDGKTNTQWRSSNSDTNPLITIDLGAVYTLNNVTLNWSSNFAKSYTILVSDDSITFKTVKSFTNQNGGFDDNANLNVTGRHIQIYVTSRSSTSAGVYLNELEINGDLLWPVSITTKKSGELMVFPNPFTDILYFKNGNQNAQIRVINVNGEVIFFGPVREGFLLTNDLKCGLYFIQEIGDNSVTTVKVIKHSKILPKK